MNSKERALLIKIFLLACLCCLLVQVFLIFTMTRNHIHRYREPSAYAEPENGYFSTSVTTPVVSILFHKIRLFFLSVLYNVYPNKVVYNGWNSLTKRQYYTPSFFRVSQTDFPFLIEAVSVCPENKVTPLAVIVIMSSWKSSRERQAIRTTWASGDYQCKFSQADHVVQWLDGNRERLIDFGSNQNVLLWRNAVRHVFLLGVPESFVERHEALELLHEENQKHQDIVVADFHDTYRNLSVKTLAGLKWVSQNCPKAFCAIKTDQDVFVHVPRLLLSMTQARFRNAIVGRYTNGVGCDVYRTGRYAIPYKAYPFEGGFPPHVKGGVYVVPLHIARQLVHVAPYMPYVSVEDVHVTGILRQAVGAQAVAFEYNKYNELMDDIWAELKHYVYGQRFASHSVKDEQSIHFMWSALQKVTLC